MAGVAVCERGLVLPLLVASEAGTWPQQNVPWRSLAGSFLPQRILVTCLNSFFPVAFSFRNPKLITTPLNLGRGSAAAAGVNPARGCGVQDHLHPTGWGQVSAVPALLFGKKRKLQAGSELINSPHVICLGNRWFSQLYDCVKDFPCPWQRVERAELREPGSGDSWFQLRNWPPMAISGEGFRRRSFSASCSASPLSLSGVQWWPGARGT